MTFSSTCPRWFVRTGASLLIAFLFAFVAGIGPLRYGFWETQEPRQLALFLLAALQGGWFAVGLLGGRFQVIRPVPILFLLLAVWVLWQLIITFAVAHSPWQAWFGNPDFGEGTYWYLTLLMTGVQAFLLWADEACRKWLLRALLVAVALLASLQILIDKNAVWNINGWGDYLAFIIGWAWVMLLIAKPELSVKRRFQLGLAALILLIALHNRVATLCFAVAFIAAQGAHEIAADAGRKSLHVYRWQRWLGVAACLFPIVYTVGSVWAAAHFETYNNDSFGLRIHLNTVGITALMNEPWRLAFGAGWDSFQDAHIGYALHDTVRLFTEGKLEPNLNSYFMGAYHSHNQPLEAMLSGGVLGFALWLGIAVVPLLRIPDALFWRTAPLHVALVITSYFWFNLSFVLGFYALYLAVLSHSFLPAKAASRSRIAPPWLAFLCIAIAFAMLWSSAQQLKAMLYSHWLATSIEKPYEAYAPEAILEDVPRGGERLAAITNQLLKRISDIEVDKALPPHKREKIRPAPLQPGAEHWVETLLQATHQMASSPHVGMQVRMTDMWVQFFLQTPQAAHPRFDGARAQSFALYPETVLRAARDLPGREDYATPYLYYLVNHGDKAELTKTLDALLAVAPQHRVALYLKGNMLLKTPSRAAEGREMLDRALAAGVAKIYPISPNTEKYSRSN